MISISELAGGYTKGEIVTCVMIANVKRSQSVVQIKQGQAAFNSANSTQLVVADDFWAKEYIVGIK